LREPIGFFRIIPWKWLSYFPVRPLLPFFTILFPISGLFSFDTFIPFPLHYLPFFPWSTGPCFAKSSIIDPLTVHSGLRTLRTTSLLRNPFQCCSQSSGGTSEHRLFFLTLCASFLSLLQPFVAVYAPFPLDFPREVSNENSLVPSRFLRFSPANLSIVSRHEKIPGCRGRELLVEAFSSL